MKIAISATGPGLDSDIDPRFGRCQYFIIADPETMEFEALENTSQTASGGAGIASAQMVAGKDVEAALTGNCGPNAYQTLEAAGIKVITGVTGKVREAVEGYKSGRFKPISGPTVDAHHGMGGGSMGGGGRGMGMGLGRGMGRGRGLGMGFGMAAGTANLEQELESLRTQTKTMGQQLNDIQRRLDDLEAKSG